MSILLRQTEVNIRERGGGRKRKPDWLVEEHGLEDGTKTPARIHLRLPSAILARLGGGHCSVVYISTPRLDQSSGFDPADPEPVPEYAFDQSLPD